MKKQRKVVFCLTVLCFMCTLYTASQGQTQVWNIFEKEFQSSKGYNNPVYDLQLFAISFKAPSGNVTTVDGFWDGENRWKVRFQPDETGDWTYHSSASDTLNKGLHGIKGTFKCLASTDRRDIYTKGTIMHSKGSYYLSHADGTPFFYTACTAWNGTLKSTEAEWETYLADRAKNHYNVIQFTATQWRGMDKNSEGQLAFEGSGRIRINPVYFQHLDKKIDAINRHGLVAAPVLLWALPVSTGKELNPGYYLPDQEAILLARYMVARYGGHHVIWILGGDGNYIAGHEQRWKNIGRAVFGQEHPGTVALHSMGKSWIGKEYAQEEWLDIIGYQSGHDARSNTIDWITRGPVSREWTKLPPKVFINMEPCYEDITPEIRAGEVRNASYHSLFAAPIAGIAYGANGIWPWIRKGEEILNHRKPAYLRTWEESISLPGSRQVGILSRFMKQHKWWEFKPAPELLMEQSGPYVSLVRSDDHRMIMAYVPVKTTLKIRNSTGVNYNGSWFDPVSGEETEAELRFGRGIIETTSPGEMDLVLILEKG